MVVSGSDEHYEEKDSVLSGECGGGLLFSWGAPERESERHRPQDQKHRVLWEPLEGHLTYVCLVETLDFSEPLSLPLDLD